MNNKTLLEVKNLTVIDQTTNNTILNNISFSIKNNEILGIVGETGSGKTITGLSIINLLTSNRLKLNGTINFHYQNNIINLIELDKKSIRFFRGKHIGMIFQEPMSSLNPAFTCGNQIVEMLIHHSNYSIKAAKQKAIHLLERVKINDPVKVFNSYPHQISGGQQQRVMIAMTLSVNPKLVIADEPTTALDVTVQKEILELIIDIKNSLGISFIFISHDLNVVAQVVDNILVLYKGNIVEYNNKHEIFRNPQNSYTKALILCRPSNNNKNKYLPTIDSYNKEQPERNINTNYSENILKVENLSVNYTIQKNFFGKITKQHKALKNISFDVYKGQTLGIVGESGSGKSTLAKAIIKLIKIDSGNIFFYNTNISSLGESEFRKYRKKIQIIFQDPYSSLNPNIKVGQSIIEVMKVHSIGKSYNQQKDIIINLFEKINLNPNIFNYYPYQLSGGQKQRVNIARALILNPEIIICDESVAALDVSVQAQVLNILNKLKNDFNLTYIFISHDISVVKYMSDDVIIMKDGEIVEKGNSDNIFSNPKNEYTKQLIEAIPSINL